MFERMIVMYHFDVNSAIENCCRWIRWQKFSCLVQRAEAEKNFQAAHALDPKDKNTLFNLQHVQKLLKKKQ